MADLSGRISERYTEITEEKTCPFCGKGKVTVTFVPGYISWRASRAAGRTKRTRFYHNPRSRVHSKCPKCGESARAIREALESGGAKPKTHEERLRRLKEGGLPTKIVSWRRSARRKA